MRTLILAINAIQHANLAKLQARMLVYPAGMVTTWNLHLMDTIFVKPVFFSIVLSNFIFQCIAIHILI